MSTVVYLPATKGIGESLGEGISQGLGKYADMAMKKKEQEMQMAKIQKVQDAIKSAPDANAAYGMINQLPLSTPEDMQHALAYVKSIFPPTDTTPREKRSFNPDTGEETISYVPAKDLIGQSSTKPQVSHFFEPIDPKSGVYSDLGKFNTTRPPSETAVTKEQLELMEKAKDNERQARSRSESTISQDLAQNKMYNNTVASMLNVKKTIGANGEFILDFSGDKTKENAYRDSLNNYREYMAKYKGDINKSAKAALTDAGAFTVKEPPPAPVEVKKPSLWERVTGSSVADKPAEKTSPKDAAKPAPSAAAPGKFIEGQVYTDAKGNKAKYVKGKWEPVK